MMRTLLSAFAVALMAVSSVYAAEVHSGALILRSASVSPSRGGAPVEGRVTIVNHSRKPDRLVAASCGCAAKVELHRMWMDGQIMRMRRADDGLAIPAGGKLELAPGGDHLMLIGVKPALQEGQHVRMTLQFEHAGKVVLDMPVKDAPPAPMHH
jgi:copper(I)-binding protein